MNSNESSRLPPLTIAAYAALALVLAAISVAITGYTFGINNNVFHIPYVLNWPQTPEFAGDAFYGTLKYFASMVWPMLRVICTESNIQTVFFVAHFISRAAAFAAMLFLIRKANITTLLGVAICALAIAASRWFQGVSVVGDHGMFIYYFTQTETTWALIFFSLALCSQNRLTSGAALTGATFSINAFVGIWLLFINGVATLAARKSATPAGISKVTIGKAAAAFTLFALPAAIWIFQTITKAIGSDTFSFMEYIRQYDPQHFLIEAAHAPAIAQFALLTTAGLIAAFYMPNRKFWLGAQAACILLFLVGIPLPYWFDNRFVFNLHLMRSTGIEQGIATVLAAIAGTKLLISAEDIKGRLLGALAILAIATLDKSVLAAGAIAIALLAGVGVRRDGSAEQFARQRFHLDRFAGFLFWLGIAVFGAALLQQIAAQSLGITQLFRAAIIAVTIVALLYARIGPNLKQWSVVAFLGAYLCSEAVFGIYWRRNEERQELAPNSTNKSWVDIIAAVKASDLHGTFLIPVAKKRREADFQLLARRQVWVDDKQGAAVMWAPWFATQWMSRHREVMALDTPDKAIAYAKIHGIPNVVIETDARSCPSPAQLKLETAHFVVCRLEETP